MISPSLLLTDGSENSTSFDREREVELRVRESVWTSVKLLLAEISKLELTSRLLFGPGLQEGAGKESEAPVGKSSGR